MATAPGDRIAGLPDNVTIHVPEHPIQHPLPLRVLLPPIEPSQYTSAQLAAVAEELGVRLSVGRTGVGWDNAQQ